MFYTIRTIPLYDLLICNGELLDTTRCKRLAQSAHDIVCADGGANKARECGITPDTIVGDMDSITSSTTAWYQSRQVEFLHLTRQDDTDFEKALKLLRTRRTEQVVVLGLTGGLLDHTLGNLSIVQRYISDMQIILFDPLYRIDIITETTTFSTQPGSRVSIVPLQSAQGVYYTGLEYHLPNASVTNGVNEGTCNRALDESFTVTLDSGVLMVFRELTDALLEF